MFVSNYLHCSRIKILYITRKVFKNFVYLFDKIDRKRSNNICFPYFTSAYIDIPPSVRCILLHHFNYLRVSVNNCLKLYKL